MAGKGQATKADLTIRPALNDGSEGQPPLEATGALGMVRVSVQDEHGTHAEYRVEVAAFPRGHETDADNDTLLLGAWRVSDDEGEDAPGGSFPVGMRPVRRDEDDADPYEITLAFAPDKGRLLAHSAPTGRISCMFGCEDPPVEGDPADAYCPRCEGPMQAVMAPSGRTYCPMPCGVVTYDDKERPVGSACPSCEDWIEREGQVPDPMAGLPQEDEGDDGEGGAGDALDLYEALVSLAMDLAEGEDLVGLIDRAKAVIEEYNLDEDDEDDEDDEEDEE